MKVLSRLSESREYYFDEGCHILELSNTPDDPEVSIARARVEPGVTTRLHRLVNTTERYVILQGEGRVDIGDNDPIDVVRGDVIRIHAGVSQRITNTSSEDLIFLVICNPRFVPDCYVDIDEKSGSSVNE
ncbi:MAG: cupin domain-containing protein [Pseudomonadota bacterium]